MGLDSAFIIRSDRSPDAIRTHIAAIVPDVDVSYFGPPQSHHDVEGDYLVLDLVWRFWSPTYPRGPREKILTLGDKLAEFGEVWYCNDSWQGFDLPWAGVRKDMEAT